MKPLFAAFAILFILAEAVGAQTINCRRLPTGGVECDNGIVVRPLPGGGFEQSDGVRGRTLPDGSLQLDTSGRREPSPGRLCIRDIYGRCQ